MIKYTNTNSRINYAKTYYIVYEKIYGPIEVNLRMFIIYWKKTK